MLCVLDVTFLQFPAPYVLVRSIFTVLFFSTFHPSVTTERAYTDAERVKRRVNPMMIFFHEEKSFFIKLFLKVCNFRFQSIDLFLLFFDCFDERGDEVGVFDRFYSFCISMDEIWIDSLDFLSDHTDICATCRLPVIAVSRKFEDFFERSFERFYIFFEITVR